jgi:hypothetical protein
MKTYHGDMFFGEPKPMGGVDEDEKLRYGKQMKRERNDRIRGAQNKIALGAVMEHVVEFAEEESVRLVDGFVGEVSANIERRKQDAVRSMPARERKERKEHEREDTPLVSGIASGVRGAANSEIEALR